MQDLIVLFSQITTHNVMSKKFLDHIYDSGLIRFLPPWHSSDLNPVEEVFAKVFAKVSNQTSLLFV